MDLQPVCGICLVTYADLSAPLLLKITTKQYIAQIHVKDQTKLVCQGRDGLRGNGVDNEWTAERSSIATCLLEGIPVY